jgi:hypothetical protein
MTEYKVTLVVAEAGTGNEIHLNYLHKGDGLDAVHAVASALVNTDYKWTRVIRVVVEPVS